MRRLAAAFSIFIFGLLGCDTANNSNRYELGKDASGNTVRLDKKTGEVAIISGDQIRTVKDAAQADAERKARLAHLEETKVLLPLDIPQLDVQVSLATSWRDGTLYFSFELDDLPDAKAFQKWLASRPAESRANPSAVNLSDAPKIDAKAHDARLKKTFSHTPFTIHLYDKNGFKLESIVAFDLTRTVNDEGLTNNLDAKGTRPMSEEDYRRVDHWSFEWR